jgi:hypothetical protein
MKNIHYNLVQNKHIKPKNKKDKNANNLVMYFDKLSNEPKL